LKKFDWTQRISAALGLTMLIFLAFFSATACFQAKTIFCSDAPARSCPERLIYIAFSGSS